MDACLVTEAVSKVSRVMGKLFFGVFRTGPTQTGLYNHRG